MPELSTQLGNSMTDHGTSLAKGVVGAVPIVGSLLAELVGNVIPNQRLDRLTRFFEKLEARLQTVEHETLKARLAQPEVVDVLEDSFFQAARAMTDERLEHVTNVVSNGLSAEQLDTAETKRMLWLLGQLNDIEIILLRGRLPRTREEYQTDEEFQSRHTEVLAPRSPTMHSDKPEFDDAALFASYRQHLIDLGLLRLRFSRPRKGELPEFDDHTGTLKASGTEVTRFGRMLLRYLNLIPHWYQL